MSIFIELFTSFIAYNENQIFIVYDVNDNIWFQLTNLFVVFKYKDPAGSAKYYKKKIIKETEDDTCVKNFSEIEVLKNTVIPNRFQPHTLFINEAGLYYLLNFFLKDDHIAQKFRRNINAQVLPKLRKAGHYSFNEP